MYERSHITCDQELIASPLQLTMTGSTLYEAVEQHALWNRLLTAVMADLDPAQPQKEVCIHLISYAQLLTRRARVAGWSNTC